MSVSWTTADPPKAARAGRPIASSSAWPAVLLRHTIGIAGLAVLLVLWWGGTELIAAPGSFLRHFAPLEAFTTLGRLATHSDLPIHVLVSVRRVLVGLGLALVIGVPIGLAVGSSALLNSATSPTFQFLRMISPLSWMPLAVMALGIGDQPIYFLLAFAAVWPILLSTAEGVRQLQPSWLRLSASLSATRWETLRRVVFPGVLAHVLTGLRLAIGVVWIVLVPCEMLGVSAGLGYFILDTRDRLAYSELTAMVLVIGLLGFLLDAAARGLNRLVTHRH
ncbi:ABC transporter permease [Bradyrhizobium canariense]|uniref:ABC transporter permease n=1 Tax=Bradyrhizobium canariense TaxID=255045 RepID=A0A1X3H3D2_9BRAD|nr:ABC transporter permease [Bradyrhizobium canariense]OSI68608.1 ABC transporter permease [Bradyrhizobium canariense]OSI78056.1 ABC transporter permease [Bradyrhizobium canariense]OSI89286.1 ABC transporter permease [Bradyrhizobium canariense]OSI93115.1 ABC transporter permease [Bradyrhizobium canariense]OSJ03085.1 ABC transporter permease [Bradyrhizobium canariense]